LGEEAKRAFDVSLVLRALGRSADADGVSECDIDLERVIGRTIVEQLGEGRGTGRPDPVSERLDDSRGVLFAPNGYAGEGGRVCVDVELEVESEAAAVDHDGDLHAVADPLGAGKNVRNASRIEISSG